MSTYDDLTHAQVNEIVTREYSTIAWYVAACLRGGQTTIEPADVAYLREHVETMEAAQQEAERRLAELEASLESDES